MKKTLQNEQWQTGKLFLTNWEKLFRSSTILLLLLINIIFIRNEFIKGEVFGIGLRVFQSVSLILVILFVYWAKRSRRFRFINESLSKDDFTTLVKTTAIDLDWQIEKLSSTHSICHQKSNIIRDGFRITILRRENEIAFNSIVNPTLTSHPFSGNNNKNNYRVFNQNLNDQKEGVDILKRAIVRQTKIELDYLADNEWSLKNTIRRIVIYSLCVFFIILGILLILHGHPTGIFSILLSVFYIILDFKALEEKVRLLKKLKKTELNKGDHA